MDLKDVQSRDRVKIVGEEVDVPGSICGIDEVIYMQGRGEGRLGLGFGLKEGSVGIQWTSHTLRFCWWKYSSMHISAQDRWF